jgi:hypothetical protein
MGYSAAEATVALYVAEMKQTARPVMLRGKANRARQLQRKPRQSSGATELCLQRRLAQR